MKYDWSKNTVISEYNNAFMLWHIIKVILKILNLNFGIKTIHQLQ